MSVIIIFAVSLLMPGVAMPVFAQEQEIPELRPQDMTALFLFEFDSLKESDIAIDEIRQLDDMARVSVSVKGTSLQLRLECRQTDFGPHWRLDENSLAMVKDLLISEETSAPESRQPIPQEDEPRRNPGTTPAAGTYEEQADAPPLSAGDGQQVEERNYRDFFEDFINTVRSGESEKFAGFYFRDDDFDYTKTDIPVEESMSNIRISRQQFISQCELLSAILSRYKEVAVVSVVANEVPEWVMAKVKEMLPTATQYYNTATVELLLDGELQTVKLRALVLLRNGWRVGMITKNLTVAASAKTKNNPR